MAKISKKEQAILIGLLKKLRPTSNGVPEEIFHALVRLVPFIAVELIIVNKKGELLLTWRDDQYWRGWHFPGGLLRYQESFERRLKLTAQRELGIRIKNFKFFFAGNYIKSPRGHDVSLAFLIRHSGPVRGGSFFRQRPKDIITEHKETWRLVKKAITKSK